MTAWVQFEARLVAVDRSTGDERPIATITIGRADDVRHDIASSDRKSALSIEAWVTPGKPDYQRDCVEARNIRVNGVMSALRRALYDVGKRRRFKPDPNEVYW